MSFVRGLDPKQSLGIGLAPKIKAQMSRSEYDYEDFYEVWKWAMEKKKNIFSYLIGFNGKNWVNGEKVDLSDSDFLWESVSEGNVAAVKALLTIPNLFPEEAFTLDQGTSELKDQYVERGHTKSPMRATNFGAYVNLASNYMHENHPNEEVEKMLKEYYFKYSNK
jgi:hypothetical protein